MSTCYLLLVPCVLYACIPQTAQWSVIEPLAAERLTTTHQRTSVAAATGCGFPTAWHGKWYESDVGDVIITSDNISRKGYCLESSDNYYLLENHEIGCYSCLLIEQRHENVLQYKESFCVGKETIEVVCSTIHTETVHRTLVRETSEAVPCPLYDAYWLAYNNNSGGFCSQPASYLSPCASDSHLHFRLERCSSSAYTYRRDMEMECLASWQDGQELYTLGRFHGLGSARKEDRYRCLTYRILGTVVHAAMSADSSCRGLRSARDGPMILELTKDVMGWPQTSCKYPGWLSRTAWRDLDAANVLSTAESGDILRLGVRTDDSTSHKVLKSFRCHRLSEDRESKSFVAMTFVSNVCKTHYQCIKFTKRKDDIVEMFTGALLDDDSASCAESELTTSVNRKLLIPMTLTSSSPCPLQGRYSIHTGSTNCDSYFRSGCNGSDVIDIISTCSSRPGLQLQCLLSWREGDRRLLLARLLGGSDATNCFSFRAKGGDMLHFSVDAECNADATSLLKDRTTYVMAKDVQVCDYAAKQSKTSGDGGRNSVSVVESAGSHVVERADQVPYQLLNNATSSRQLRTHKTTRHQAPAGGASTSNAASLTSAATEMLRFLHCLGLLACILTANLLSCQLASCSFRPGSPHSRVRTS